MLLNVFLEELGKLQSLRDIRLVEDDNARALAQVAQAGVLLQQILVVGQFLLQGLDIGDGVAARLQRRDVDDVRENRGALNVAQEVEAQTLALGGARDKARNVGDGEGLVAHIDHAEVWLQRGKWVVANLRLRGREHGNQRGLARRREAHEAHIRHGLEFEHEIVCLARLALQREARGLALRGGQRRVAQATKAALSRDEPGARDGQVREHLPLLVVDHGAGRNFQDEVLAARTIAPVACAIRATAGLDVRTVVEVHERVDLRGDLEHDIATVATIAAVGAAQRLELLAVDGRTAVSAVARLQVEHHAVNKACHGNPSGIKNQRKLDASLVEINKDPSLPLKREPRALKA